MNGHQWIGVDFDGTLARHDAERFPAAGEPIDAMVRRVRGWLEVGHDVRIVTARAGEPVMPAYVAPVVEFCIEHFGRPLPVRASKDFQMLALWDDRAVRVEDGEPVVGVRPGLRVVHQPNRMSGEATVGDSRLTCTAVAGRVWAGEDVESIAHDYGTTEDEVRLACWWLAKHSHCVERWEQAAEKAWRTWAQQWGEWAWGGTRPPDHPGNPCADPKAVRR